MKRLTYIFLLMAVGSLLVLAPSCRKEKKYRIAVSQCSSDNWRDKMNIEMNREMMLHDDVEIEIRSAEDSNEKQIADIRYFIENGFDILIVAPNEAKALTPVIKEVYEKGIPVIIFDRNIEKPYYTARIGADDVGLGRSAARYALHLLKDRPRNALEIYGLPGSTPADDRHKGFADEFKAGGGRIVASVAADWNHDTALRLADSALRHHPEITLIYAHNDRMAIGASETARRMGRDDIKIIGIDAAPEIGVKAVADSVIDATFLYPTEGDRIIRTALDILQEKPYEKEVILPVVSGVDRSNADMILLQDQHLNEETRKLGVLKSQINDYWARHNAQTTLFYVSVALIVLLTGVVFLVLRSYWQHKRHQAILLKQNRMLEEERDKQRELNAKLEEATQAKLIFFTNVSHDLRTPLTLIAEPVAQLARAENLTESQRTMIRIADKNVNILKRLINQILDFRKYENGKLNLRLTEIDLGQALREWTDSFNDMARSRHIKYTLQPPAEDVRISIAVDVEKLERVMFNLISNAFKHTPDNGSVSVSYALHGDEASVSVTDTGRGISRQDIENIFNRFFQVDRVHPNGSGIGLSLSKAFVEMHGGRISVASTLKKGSVFTVTIPVRHTAEQETAIDSSITKEDVEAELGLSENETSFEADKPLVLVIDDNKDIILLVTQLLSVDYNVISACDGAEGVKKAMKYVPDLVICDVMMPVMDGLECCRHLKSELSTSHIPVLMLTACSMDEQRVQGYESGADGYLAKPFSNEVLASRIKSLIENRKRIRRLTPDTSAVRRPKEKPAPAQAGDIDNDFYRRFLAIFEKEIGNPDIGVDEIASRLGLERSQFYRKIKALTNYSPVELIRSMRLKEARRLLTVTDRTISEVAYEVGFSTPAYFSKCFRDAFGETPSELRARLHKQC